MGEREHRTWKPVELHRTFNERRYLAQLEKDKKNPETFRESAERERREQARLWGERRSQVFNR